MSKEIYDELFDYYDISRTNSKIKTIRVYIMRRLEKEYKTKEWDNLSEYEKNRFKLIHMYKYLIKFSRNPKKAEKKVAAELNESFIQLQELHEHNKNMEKLYIQYFDPSMSEEEKLNAYQEFCADLKKSFPGMISPSFSVWKSNPLRIYDYISDPNSEVDTSAVELASIPQEKIDHEILECIMQIIKEKWKLEIDIAGIRKCLLTTKDIDLTNNTPLLNEIDCDSAQAKNEQQRIIENNIALIEASNKLKNHDFIVNC